MTLDERLAQLEREVKELPLDLGDAECASRLDRVLMHLANARLQLTFLRQQMGSTP